MTWSEERGVLVVVVVTGLALAVLGLNPTGSTFADVVVLAIGGVAAVWCGASAPWWSIAALGALGTALAGSWVGAALGLLVVIDSVVAGRMGLATRFVRAGLIGGAMVSLALALEIGPWGVNAAIAIGAVVVIGAIGILVRPEGRRVGLIALAAFGAVAVASVVAAALVGQSARADLVAGNSDARSGLRHLEAGDFDRAQESFTDAATSFDRAAGALGSPLVQPARLVPVVSQHVEAGAELSRAAFDAARTVERQLESIDVDALTINDGRIDLEAVRSLSGSMAELQLAIDDLDDAVTAARSGWLLDPVVRVLDDLTDDLERQRDRGEHVVAALEVAPEMLGGDGERVYLVMFTTPAEARGQGGFMGNWAELSIDDGRITMSEYGNDEELNEGGPRPRRLEHAPPDWIERYGQFGFVHDDGNVGEVPWKNITMSPNFPATAQVAAELYPQSGGRPVDGVFALDVYALEALIGLVGPIEVDGAPRPLNGKNAAEFLLFEQYLTDDHGSRGDMLNAVTVAAVDRMLRTNPPDPLDLGKKMAPLVDERRVVAWSAHDAEQELFATLGLDGALRSGVEQMVSVSLVNGGGSKIDSFLDHDVEVVRGPDGLQLRLELVNEAPAGGLPDFIIGNMVGLPTGTSRLWVTGYASVPITGATANGEPLDAGFSSEAGLAAVSAFVELGPGTSTVVEFDLDAPDLAPDDFDVVLQPLARQPTDSIGR